MKAPLLPDGRYLIVVRRGDPPLLFGLGTCLECTDNVEAIQDRRVGDRCSGTGAVQGERRMADRRRTVMGSALAVLVEATDNRPDPRQAARQVAVGTGGVSPLIE